ncbi:hypothetical protein M9H77_03091 [Catharanthus roseus]|uniref:Uncharacterized protein n=1 Tax=Catharanthus roseus TaxID=4058 RepID=A0ACC0CA53_CATRO|nr:hypothetical protein M9H77_03091 [Catharanthus roseus]
MGCTISAQKIYNVVAKIKKDRMQRNCEDSNVLSDIVVAHPTSIQMMRTWPHVHSGTGNDKKKTKQSENDENKSRQQNVALTAQGSKGMVRQRPTADGRPRPTIGGRFY